MNTTDRHGAPTTVGLLRNRNFILLWCAYAVSALGDHVSEMGILKTQHALNEGVAITPLMARMSFTFFVPFFFLAPVAGVLADRLPRRALMVTADLARCAIMLGFAALIAWMSGWSTWGPFLPLLAVGTFACLFSPARSALLPTLVRPDQLIRANGLISGLGIIATMIAAGISGYLADHYHPLVSFRVDAATFAASATLLAFLRPPRPTEVAHEGHGRSASDGGLLSGFRYALCHRRVLELLAVASLIWFCGALVNSVIPAVVRDVYGGTYQQMSGFRVLLAVGFVLGAILIATLGNALRSDIVITWGLFGIAGAITVFASSVFLGFERNTLRLIGGTGVVLAGLFAVGVMASFNALLQRIVADRHRGRIFGAKDVCCTGALLVATGLLGVPHWVQVDRWVGYILIGVAGLTAVVGFMTLRVRIRRSDHPPLRMMVLNLNEFVAKFWWRLRRIGRPTVPRAGPVLIAANHVSAADPALLGAAIPYRAISFMVAAEYARWPLIRFLVRLLECIPVKRGMQDVRATKQALRHLHAGKAVCIFLEGEITRPGKAGEPKDGVALLALRTGTVVIPAHLSGMRYRDGIVAGLLTRHDARVRMGTPVDLSGLSGHKPDRETIRVATQRIYAAICSLAPTEVEPESSDQPIHREHRP